jgi:hypothetical protein
MAYPPEKKFDFKAQLNAERAAKAEQLEKEAQRQKKEQEDQERFIKEARPLAAEQFKQLQADIEAQTKDEDDLLKYQRRTPYQERSFGVVVNNKHLVIISFEPNEAEIAVSLYDVALLQRHSFVPNSKPPVLGENTSGYIFYQLSWDEKTSVWMWKKSLKRFDTRFPSGSNSLASYFQGQAGKGISYEQLLENMLQVIATRLKAN